MEEQSQRLNKSKSSRDRIARLGLFLCILWGMTSCVVPLESIVTDVDSKSWHKEAILQFKNADSLSRLNLSLFLRCEEPLTEDTLSFRIKILTPDHLQAEEIFTARIKAQKGTASLHREAILPYRHDVQFKRKGTYQIIVQPLRPQRGISSVGLHFKNIKNKE